MDHWVVIVVACLFIVDSHGSITIFGCLPTHLLARAAFHGSLPSELGNLSNLQKMYIGELVCASFLLNG